MRENNIFPPSPFHLRLKGEGGTTERKALFPSLKKPSKRCKRHDRFISLAGRLEGERRRRYNPFQDYFSIIMYTAKIDHIIK
jgi:hypothetical protein